MALKQEKRPFWNRVGEVVPQSCIAIRHFKNVRITGGIEKGRRYGCITLAPT